MRISDWNSDVCSSDLSNYVTPTTLPKPLAMPFRSSRMATSDPLPTSRLSPMEVHQRLRAGLAEAVVSRAGIRHEGLNAFLRRTLAGADPAQDRKSTRLNSSH